MIIGAHTIICSKDPDADRAFFRDVIGLTNIDLGGGWLVFGLPPSELAFHPAKENGAHELYLMCDDVTAFVTEMTENDIKCTEVHEESWGQVTELTLPGGGTFGVYQPSHERPDPVG